MTGKVQRQEEGVLEDPQAVKRYGRGPPPVRPRRGSALGSPGSGPVSRVTGWKAEAEGNTEVEGTVRDR